MTSRAAPCRSNTWCPATTGPCAAGRASRPTTLWSYYTLEVGGARNPDAVWYYTEPSPAAENIRGRMAFWHGVTVEL
ncbi:DUF427 domain-containing protein [Arthrobacter mobilis]|uniref:DUF427 domain-containing protein n=1 Tax=Arthrobacter mobilis TaxID=2724944 RepID=UPI0035E42CD9